MQANQPVSLVIPELEVEAFRFENQLSQFKSVLESIGGELIEMDSLAEINTLIASRNYKEIFSGISGITGNRLQEQHPQALEDIQLAVITGEFGVAENGAIWLTQSNLPDRALPFITAHLMLVIDKDNLVHNMHEAYDRIANQSYELGAFIAGPSKTADIEQSLVLGAHGAKSLTVIVL